MHWYAYSPCHFISHLVLMAFNFYSMPPRFRERCSSHSHFIHLYIREHVFRSFCMHLTVSYQCEYEPPPSLALLVSRKPQVITHLSAKCCLKTECLTPGHRIPRAKGAKYSRLGLIEVIITAPCSDSKELSFIDAPCQRGANAAPSVL